MDEFTSQYVYAEFTVSMVDQRWVIQRIYLQSHWVYCFRRCTDGRSFRIDQNLDTSAPLHLVRFSQANRLDLSIVQLEILYQISRGPPWRELRSRGDPAGCRPSSRYRRRLPRHRTDYFARSRPHPLAPC